MQKIIKNNSKILYKVLILYYFNFIIKKIAIYLNNSVLLIWSFSKKNLIFINLVLNTFFLKEIFFKKKNFTLIFIISKNIWKILFFNSLKKINL